MRNKKLSELGARLLGEKASNLGMAALDLESLLLVSPSYGELLTTIGGAIIFDNGAKYIPDEATPLTRTDGYNSLEVLFGLGNGKHSIRRAAQQYEGQLPPSFVPIGAAPGGNLICVDRTGIVFLWDHESQIGGHAWPVATSLEKFIDQLEPDKSDNGGTDNIVEAESFLDF